MGQKTITHMPGRTWIIWNFFFFLLLFRLSSSHSMNILTPPYINTDALHVSNFCMCRSRKSSWSGEKLLHDLLKACCVCVDKDSRGRKLVAKSFKLPTCAHHSIRIPLIDYHSLKLFHSPKTSDTEAFSGFFGPLEKLLHHHHRCSFIFPLILILSINNTAKIVDRLSSWFVVGLEIRKQKSPIPGIRAVGRVSLQLLRNLWNILSIVS